MHFYSQDGSPRHFVAMSTRNGTRPTRITDVVKAAKNGEVWLPSVSTVLGILDKPALKGWLVNQHLEAAWTLIDNVDARLMELDEFKRSVREVAEQNMAKAPDAGTDIHDQLERWFQGDDNVKRPDICRSVQQLVYDKTGCHADDFVCERRFTDTEHGFGGTVDLSCEGVIVDFKSKQHADKFKPGKMAYPDHARQLAAYGKGVGATPQGDIYANLFICLETGELDWHHWSEPDIERGWDTFSDALSIYHREIYNPFDYM